MAAEFELKGGGAIQPPRAVSEQFASEVKNLCYTQPKRVIRRFGGNGSVFLVGFQVIRC
jgi:hypothetical protein